MRYSVCHLLRSDAFRIVGVAVGLFAFRYALQLAASLPCQLICCGRIAVLCLKPVQWIAARVILACSDRRFRRLLAACVLITRALTA